MPTVLRALNLPAERRRLEDDYFRKGRVLFDPMRQLKVHDLREAPAQEVPAIQQPLAMVSHQVVGDDASQVLHPVLLIGNRGEHPQVVIMHARFYRVQLVGLLPRLQQLLLVFIQLDHLELTILAFAPDVIGHDAAAVLLRQQDQHLCAELLQVVLHQGDLHHAEAPLSVVLLRVGNIRSVQNVVEVVALPGLPAKPSAKARHGLKVRRPRGRSQLQDGRSQRSTILGAQAHLRSFAGASWAFSLAGEVHNLACVSRGRGHG
mmetsp:Transcript_18034/g.68386  ORF Transcript_18034/g.68386 Transcript_18034/m.68386 type:complete len:262 (-) Transcript_18034:23-808(-)